jgi:hypothetical protein
MQLGNLAAVHGKTNMLGVAVTAEVVVEFEETILEGIIAGDAPKEAPAWELVFILLEFVVVVVEEPEHPPLVKSSTLLLLHASQLPLKVICWPFCRIPQTGELLVQLPGRTNVQKVTGCWVLANDWEEAPTTLLLDVTAELLTELELDDDELDVMVVDVGLVEAVGIAVPVMFEVALHWPNVYDVTLLLKQAIQPLGNCLDWPVFIWAQTICRLLEQLVGRLPYMQGVTCADIKNA